jgi:hypothetical protein
MALRVEHLDLDRVAELHELGHGLALIDGFQHALLGDAAVALRAVDIGDRARAHDAAGAHVAGLADMGDQLAEVEHHVGAAVGLAHLLAVPVHGHRQVHLALAPGLAEFVGRHRHRRECRGRLALEEAEALAQFGRDQVAQRDIVGQHHQADGFAGLLGRGAHPHVAGNHGHLGLEVDAEGLAGADDIVLRPDEVVRAALVHQRVGPELGWHLGAARLAH